MVNDTLAAELQRLYNAVGDATIADGGTHEATYQLGAHVICNWPAIWSAVCAEQIAESANCPLHADVADAVTEIESYFSEATNNLCTCQHTELGCPYCNAWERAERKTATLLQSLLTTLASGRDEARGKPVAWMYERECKVDGYSVRFEPIQQSLEYCQSQGWTETPLYALLPQGDQP